LYLVALGVQRDARQRLRLPLKARRFHTDSVSNVIIDLWTKRMDLMKTCDEVMRAIIEAEQGNLHIRSVEFGAGGPAERGSWTHNKYWLSNGWAITVFWDCAEFDYIDEVEFPDGTKIDPWDDKHAILDEWQPLRDYSPEPGCPYAPDEHPIYNCICGLMNMFRKT
jgi:hypothetical protein